MALEGTDETKRLAHRNSFGPRRFWGGNHWRLRALAALLTAATRVTRQPEKRLSDRRT